MSIMLRRNKLFNLEPAHSELDRLKKENSFPSTKKSELNDSSSLFVGEGVTITGKIIAKNEIKINGKVQADVEAKKIFIGNNGEVVGKIKTSTLQVEGNAKGEINVDSLLKILSTGSIDGRITYEKLDVEKGGCIKGELKVKENKQQEFNELIPKKNTL